MYNIQGVIVKEKIEKNLSCRKESGSISLRNINLIFIIPTQYLLVLAHLKTYYLYLLSLHATIFGLKRTQHVTSENIRNRGLVQSLQICSALALPNDSVSIKCRFI